MELTAHTFEQQELLNKVKNIWKFVQKEKKQISEISKSIKSGTLKTSINDACTWENTTIIAIWTSLKIAAYCLPVWIYYALQFLVDTIQLASSIESIGSTKNSKPNYKNSGQSYESLVNSDTI